MNEKGSCAALGSRVPISTEEVRPNRLAGASAAQRPIVLSPPCTFKVTLLLLLSPSNQLSLRSGDFFSFTSSSSSLRVYVACSMYHSQPYFLFNQLMSGVKSYLILIFQDCCRLMHRSFSFRIKELPIDSRHFENSKLRIYTGMC